MTAQAATSVETFAVARTVDEALAARSELGDAAAFLAGGTDLGVVMRRRIVEPRHLIDVSRIEELGRIEAGDEETVIGAAVTHRTIETSPLFSGAAVALQEACATVGSIQTRNVGTLGGNLCNASPAADTATALLALDASVEIAGAANRRTVPLDRFFLGYRTTTLEPGELLVSIRVPATQGGSSFMKLGRRAAMEISIACAAVHLVVGRDGTITSARVGLGSVAATPIRSAAAEEALIGAGPSDATWAGAGLAAVADAEPIDDVRATARYRSAMIPVIVARAAARAWERCGRTS